MKLRWRYFTMTKLYPFFFVCVLALGVLSACHAQEDARLWLKAGVKKKINQGLDLRLVSSVRLGENYSRVNSCFFQLSAEQRIVKGIKLGVDLRQIYRRKTTPAYHSRQRVSIWLDVKKNILSKLEVLYRPMYMRQYTDLYTSENGLLPTDIIRNKIGLQYKLRKKYSPFVSCELYYRMRYDYRDFNRIRYTLGMEYNFDKYNQVTAFYRIQKRLNENTPMTAYILAFEYLFIF